jgi:hypothetical protein
MIIQSGYGTQAYIGIAASSIQRLEGRTVTASIAETAKYADKVSLSDAGKALAASEATSTEKLPYLPYQEYWLGRASADPAFAKELAEIKAYGKSAIITNMSEVRLDPTLPGNKLSTTGRIADNAYEERFEREAAVVDAKRRALYESEKAKGTDPVEILRKLYDFENVQSYEYQEATGLGWRGETAAPSQSGKTSTTADLQALRSEIDLQRRALMESEKAKEAERLEMLTSLIKAGRHAFITPEKDKEPDILEILREMTDLAGKLPITA